ncbi:MAG TPA: hypothetical protein VEQ10_00925 [Vicinamibacteria bacterium]|nr:hypothetical protein [Vicinamibacteria bacterium]
MDEPGESGAADQAAGDSREPWHEGPDEEAPEESWLALEDDALLHRIETLGSEEDHDERLLEVVASLRHFFIRQEAAKRLRDRRLLFAYEDDRHIGQILIRHLTRREDLTYLERLSACARHVEVRSAAQVQLARVWRKVEVPPEPPEAEPPEAEPTAAEPSGLESAAPEPASVQPVAPPAPVAEEPVDDPLATTVFEIQGVDASLLGWAAHFVVEDAWNHLGTTATRELLRRTHRELLSAHPTLQHFRVTDDAHVIAGMPTGARFPTEAVQAVAAWISAFRQAAGQVAPEVEATTIRACTSLMADALRDAGFYTACDAADAAESGTS